MSIQEYTTPYGYVYTRIPSAHMTKGYPVLYLDPELFIRKDGDGSYNNPYQIWDP